MGHRTQGPKAKGLKGPEVPTSPKGQKTIGTRQHRDKGPYGQGTIGASAMRQRDGGKSHVTLVLMDGTRTIARKALNLLNCWAYLGHVLA